MKNKFEEDMPVLQETLGFDNIITKGFFRKPRLLIAADNFLPRIDGVSIFLTKIIPMLSDTYDITVVAPHFGNYSPKGFTLVTIPTGNLGMGDYKAAKFRFKIIKKLVTKADLVFSQTIGPVGFLAIMYAKKMRTPVATFMHILEWELLPMATNNIILRRFLFPVMKIITRNIYNKPDLIIVPSEGISEIITWHGIRTKKKVVHLGVDSDIFRPISELTDKEKEYVENLRNELALGGSFVIGTHGRLAREKDLYTLLRAFKWIHKKDPNTKLLILGDGLQEIKKKLLSVEGVILPGSKENVHYYLNLMDVYVTSSLTETTSLSTLEAMASGLPVISTPVGFIKDYIKDNVNGFIFPAKDDFFLFKKIELIKNNKFLGKTVGERARATVVRKFKWRDTVDGIKSALSSIEY